jgi:hypothetical protein
VCYDFKERRIAAAHYTIRSNEFGPGFGHLKSWLVETSADRESWWEVAHEESNKSLNNCELPTGTFSITAGGESCFIRAVPIRRNHRGDDRIAISVPEIVGSLLE